VLLLRAMEDDPELETIVRVEDAGGLEPARESLAKKGSLSPQLEMLRLQGTSPHELHSLYEEEASSMFLDEPMSLPADFSASDASELLMSGLAEANSMGVGGPRPSSQPAHTGGGSGGEGPMTWPHSASMMQFGGAMPSQPVSGVSTPDASGGHRRLFALPRLPASLASLDDGQVAEEDSVEFRENLNRLNGECAGKLDTADNVAELTQELAEATLALAAIEQRFMPPPEIHPADEAASALVTSESAIEALGRVMQVSGQSRESFAARLTALNEAAALAQSLAIEGAAAAAAAAAADGSPNKQDSSAAAVVDSLRTSSQEQPRTGGRRPSFSGPGRERKRSVWREVAKKVPVGGQAGDYKKRMLKELDEMAIAVEKATIQYEEALAMKLDFALDGDATESSEEAASCRKRKKALDKLRIQYVAALERLHAEKEAELLDRAADTFFAQRESVAAVLAAMDRAAPRFEAMRKSAEAVREEAAEMEDRRQRMGQAVEAKEVKRKDIRDLTNKAPRGPAAAAVRGRKRAQTMAAGSNASLVAAAAAVGENSSPQQKGAVLVIQQHPKLGELPVIPSQDVGPMMEQEHLDDPEEEDEEENGDEKEHVKVGVKEDDEDDEDADVHDEDEDEDEDEEAALPVTPPPPQAAAGSAQPKQIAAILAGSAQPKPPASPKVRRETVLFGKAGFVFVDSPSLSNKTSAVAALATPRVRERKRWVRAWCALDSDGKLEMQVRKRIKISFAPYHFVQNTILLPSQARDEHTEKSKRDALPFLQRLPPPSSSATAGTTPPRGGSRGEKHVALELARCEVVVPQVRKRSLLCHFLRLNSKKDMMII
jgi:hypothetical protein